MVKQQLLKDLQDVLTSLGYKTSDIVLSIPQNTSFGDYSTNIALQLAKLKSKNGKQNPMEIANAIVTRIKSLESSQKYLEKIEVANPGFINFFIKDKSLIKNLAEVSKPLQTTHQKILVEYGHANLLKEIHIGHLRTFILGESLSRIFEFLGHKVFRANYQGDIGLHIAKAIWGIKKLGWPKGELTLEEKAKFLGQAYVEGNLGYDSQPAVKEEIDGISNALYQKSTLDIEEINQKARQWSLEYQARIYEKLGIKYNRLFFETQVADLGKKIVLDNLDGIFEKSDGAIIFRGEKYGLHNRVFINSTGNPTYEAKDVGLAELEYDAFTYDQAIHVVGSEQAGYFQVILKVLELLFSHLQGKKYHLSYGMVGLSEGKMSSRTGNVVTVDDLVRVVSQEVKKAIKNNRLEVGKEIPEEVIVGAIKFTYLKFAPSSNMVFDPKQSVSLQGDSGPYLQYTHARIKSVLEKANLKLKDNSDDVLLDEAERMLLVRLEYFNSIIEEAGQQYRPNLICEYLLDLAKDFNLFYQQERIIGSEKEEFRLVLSSKVSEVLQIGLNLLGIKAPEKM